MNSPDITQTTTADLVFHCILRSGKENNYVVANRNLFWLTFQVLENTYESIIDNIQLKTSRWITNQLSEFCRVESFSLITFPWKFSNQTICFPFVSILHFKQKILAWNWNLWRLIKPHFTA